MYISLLSYLFFYFIVILFYFRVAGKLSIIDKPNQRSSHTYIIIRGAGVLFPLAFLVPIFIGGDLFSFRIMVLGLLIISSISFIDDIMTLNNKFRLFIHIVAVVLLLWQIHLNFWYGIPVLFIIVGIINAYNFMDGINGITALYSLLAIMTFYYISQNDYFLLDHRIFISLIAAIVVFSFFNLRKKAKCFSGDVGSISMAFILSYLMLQLVIGTSDIKWIVLLGVYGLDTVVTILLRLKRKENILEAHRSHFYQYLVNEKGMSHSVVSVLYVVVQGCLNVVIISQTIPIILVTYSIMIIVYLYCRLKWEGRKRLFVNYQQ